MNLQNIFIAQNGLRLHHDEIKTMINFVRNGGQFSKETLERYDPNRTSLIAISKFPDGNHFIRDGLHRSLAIYIGRDNTELYENEFVLETMTYDQYTNASPDNGWYTPFDPRIEVRKADFHDFKEQVLEIEKNQGDILEFIAKNKRMYSVLRSHKHTLENLATSLKTELQLA